MGRSRPLYKRVLIKLSGEVLGGSAGGGFDWQVIDLISESIKEIADSGIQIGIVVGGGNILRGRQIPADRLDRNNADFVGMLATVMNGVVLKEHLGRLDMVVELFSALHVPAVANEYTIGKARQAIEQGRVVILSGGTGHPYFSTDTGAALRAAELGAEVVLKGTNVDGVYTADPKKNPDATKIKEITYQDVIERQLGVMDLTAVSLCMQAGISVRVFSILDPLNLVRVCFEPDIGTLIH